MKKNSFFSPDLTYAVKTLLLYKRDKSKIEARIRDEEEIWRGVYSGGESCSWIFNSVINKDAITAVMKYALAPLKNLAINCNFLFFFFIIL